MSNTTLYLFPTSVEAEGFARLCPAALVAVVGVGMAEAAATTARLLAEQRPSRVVLAGIAGACDEQLQVGDVVEVECDRVAGLPMAYSKEYYNHCVGDLPVVQAFSVSHTGDSLRYGLPKGCSPAIEQMEGAAVAAVCRAFGVEFSHFRAISNRVSDERAAWRVGEALEALVRELEKVHNK
jgi:nucleoside phosphorylase